MRSSKSRSRNKSNRQRSLGNVVNRVFDSSGPEGKVRGTPQQVIEKYLNLARDAQLSNDRVAEQSFLQHAEHYTRMLGEAQREMAERQQQNNQRQNGDDDRSNGYHNGHRDNGRDDQPRDSGREDQSRNNGREDQPHDYEPAAASDDRSQHSADRGERVTADEPEPQQRRQKINNRNEGGEPRSSGRRPRRSEDAASVASGLPDPVDSVDDAGRLDLPEAPIAKKPRRKQVKADMGDEDAAKVAKPRPARRKSKTADQSTAEADGSVDPDPADQG